MSFFVKSARKTRAVHKKRGVKPSKKSLPISKKPRLNDVEITSDEDDDDDGGGGENDALHNPSAAGSGDESDIDESVEQKKLRIAKQYIEEIRKKELDDEDDEEQKRSLIAHRLKRDVLEQTGRLFKPLAVKLKEIDSDSIVRLKNQHRLPITRVVLSADEKVAFSASKDGCLVRWSIDTAESKGQRSVRVKAAHSAAILALALSTDSKYLASGCEKNVLTIWNPANLERLHTFGMNQHRGKVTGLAFRLNTHQLFSCSADRSVKVWSLDEMAYVETLFGHEDTVTGIDSFLKDRALSSGGLDGTLRLWKIPEESQLIFHGNGTSVDCCAMLNDETFVSGHDDGKVYLWTLLKKKPVFSLAIAKQWVTAVAAMRNSDLVAAGSSSGKIVLMKTLNCQRDAEGRPALEEVAQIPCVGFINSLAFSSSSRLLIAACSQEHALGRWERIKESRNAVCVFPLVYSS